MWWESGVGWSLSLVAVVLVSGCRTTSGPGAGRPPAAWLAAPQRGDWEVQRTVDGRFVAEVVDLVTEERLYVTRSVTTTPQPWEAWLTWGSEGAAERISYVLSSGDRRVLGRYDQRAATVLPALPAGARYERTEGARAAGGAGLTTPWKLPPQLDLDPADLWLGIRAQPTAVKSPLCPAQTGLKVSLVYPTSPAEQMGVKANDVIVRIAPWPYDAPLYKTEYFGQELYARFRPGDLLAIELLRTDEKQREQRLTLAVPMTAVPGVQFRLRPEVAEFAGRWAKAPPPPLQAVFETLSAKGGAAAHNADLLARLSASHGIADAFRMGQIVVAHRSPFQTEPMVREYLQRLPPPGPQRITQLIGWLDSVYLTPAVATLNLPATRDVPQGDKTVAVPTFREWQGKGLPQHLDYIEDVLREAAACHGRAFRDFTKADLDFLDGQAQDFFTAWLEVKMMYYDGNKERLQKNLRFLELARKLDREALLQQALVLARLTQADFLASLKAQMEAAAKAGGLGGRNTPSGAIVLAGAGNDQHANDAAVLVDLGGDDIYINNSGSAVRNQLPSAVLVDFAGNDQYLNTQAFRQGSGAFGVGFLLDLGGDDMYVAPRYAQGTGFFGIGILADAAGNDQYRAVDYSQGVGQFGAGVLLDDEGENRYDGNQACQGVGFTWGIGLLYASAAQGRDHYFCSGQEGSGYGDPGSFEGWGQGIGIGHRVFASGGVGALVDEGGDDEYYGGTFSQGGGYFYGLGILQDRHGNDRYRGSRYNMGFTAHQAGGVFLEEEGNDRYEQLHFVAQGMAWDESTTIFTDRKGDDFYLGRSFAFGASAMNGFTVFTDSDGSDHYDGNAPGAVNGNSYHGGTSVGFFADLGAGTDVFAGGRQAGEVKADEAKSTEQGHSFFVDASTVEAALEKARQPPPPAAPAAK